MLSIAIVDTLGLTYDGSTLERRGLGGSESAVILMSKELVKQGFKVTVFNNCRDSQAWPGIYDGVEYIDLGDIEGTNHTPYDVVISTRSVVPFLPRQYEKDFSAYKTEYSNLFGSAKHKILWMHDTFCTGDNLIEELVEQGYIDEIFTLSDFHSIYITNCHHGRRRNFEFLKNKIFVTRNGAIKYIDETCLKSKDPNLFVYNASATKGMVPLIEDIWPQIKQRLPAAKLVIIGGYYRFRENAAPDAQEETVHKYANNPDLAAQNIWFTGIIKQQEIATILARATYMLYPAAFPETFGISSLESLLYNTPVITCNFGALEQIATDATCYKIDYAIESNVLFTDINKEKQVRKFVNLVVDAVNNPYLLQQKQYACNELHDIAGWDTVALQWKQHLYRRFGLFLPVNDYRRVQYINCKVQKVFGYRFVNTQYLETIQANNEQPIVVVVPFRNAEKYIEKCIDSIASQDYDTYTCYLVADAPEDNTIQVVTDKLSELPENIRSKFVFHISKENRGAVHNQVTIINEYANPDDIIILIDGDDWLVNDNNIFKYYNYIFSQGYDFSYGSCWSVVDNIPLIAQPYPKAVIEGKAFRSCKFSWGIPYTHLRAFKAYLLINTPYANFQDDEGKWYKAGGDGEVFYSTIEKAKKIYVSQRIVYNYNDASPHNDYKINSEEQTKTAMHIQNKYSRLYAAAPAVTNTLSSTNLEKKKVLIAIPTARNIEVDTFKSIYDLIIPDNVETTFQYFYGYQVDQVRNLIAHWVDTGPYDYVLCVDADIVLPQDTLVKMLHSEKDIISGVYRQRKDEVILELYKSNGYGGVTNIDLGELPYNQVIEVDACGFGCVLVSKSAIKAVGYPYFTYHSVIDHKNTVSEDIDFCVKARKAGFRIYADTSIRPLHIGQQTFKLPEAFPIMERFKWLYNNLSIPQSHIEYLNEIKDENPKVIYDIGACVGHWTREARKVWPNSKIILFEALRELGEFYTLSGERDFYLGLLSKQSGTTANFYCNIENPGGNSYYRENIKYSPDADRIFPEHFPRKLVTKTLYDVHKEFNLPAPDLIKIDVQGAELDILKGAGDLLREVKHLILELQSVEYNKGAPLKDEVIDWLSQNGFKLVKQIADQGPDGDYHFIRR